MNSKERKRCIEIIKKNSSALSPVTTGLNAENSLTGEIKAFIFDIYGTLFVSGSGDIGTVSGLSREDMFLDAFKAAGFTVRDKELGGFALHYFEEAIVKRHRELREKGFDYPEINIVSIWEALSREGVKRGLLAPEYDEEMIVYLSVEFETKINPVWPMGDLAGLFESLLKKNIVLGVVSNAQFYTPLLFPAFIGRDLAELGFDEDLTVFSYRYELAKPSLQLFSPIAEGLENKFGITPDEAVYIGNDMLNDIYASGSAGFRTCLFAGDERSLRLREDHGCCNDLHPDAIVVSIEQIPGLV